jgi:hypothetical protein
LTGKSNDCARTDGTQIVNRAKKEQKKDIFKEKVVCFGKRALFFCMQRYQKTQKKQLELFYKTKNKKIK